jgi:hypothetical protein
MRTLFSVVFSILLSANVMGADRELWAARRLITEIAKVNPAGYLAAQKLLDCNIEAAQAIGEADRLSPAKLAAESMAKEAASRCTGEALRAVFYLAPKQGEAVRAAILKANAEAAIGVRKPPPVIVCSSGSKHPCGTPLKR